MFSEFIIENGYNTSYIDTVLLSLFYKPTHLASILTQLPEKKSFVYLQDMIYFNIIEQIRKNFSISSGMMNEIRNCSISCGWKTNYNITDLYNPIDYLNFLINGLNIGDIKCDLVDSTNIESFRTNYITMQITNNNDIRSLLDKWTDTHLKKNVNGIYRFTETPVLIPIYLDRRSENNQINKYEIDIKKKIKFNDDMSWIIHAIICYSSTGNGQYYCIINMDDNNQQNNSWKMFNNNKIPSIMNINIKDPNYANKIKQECTIILYRLNDTLCKF